MLPDRDDTASASANVDSVQRFTKAELLHRACLRAALCMRSLYEEKGASDTRLLNPPIIPDELVVVGRSRNYRAPGRREHVVPRLVVTERCHEMIHAGRSDDEIAAFIASHLRIVLLTQEESRRLDLKAEINLRQAMPSDWTFGGDLFRRLQEARIEWALDPMLEDAISDDMTAQRV